MHRVARYIISAGFMFAGIMHFVKPAPFISIYPQGWPAPKEAVMLSGLAEVLGAIGLLVPATRGVASNGLILLLVAVFPANINMAANAQRFAAIPSWVLWLRLPLQFLLLWAVWRARK